MNRLIALLVKLWLRLAGVLLKTSFRTWFLSFAFLFCVMPGNAAFLSVVDRSLISIVAKASGVYVGAAEVGVVHVPDDVASSWESDFYSADKLALLVSNILHSSYATIGLLLDESLASQLTTLDRHLKSSPIIDDSTIQMLNRKYYLQEMLSDPRVVLGMTVPVGVEPKQRLFSMQNTRENQLDFLSHWYSACINCTATQLNLELPSPDFEHGWFAVFPLVGYLERLWYRESGEYFATFLSAMYFNQHSIVENNEPSVVNIEKDIQRENSEESASLFTSFSEWVPFIHDDIIIPLYRASKGLKPKVVNLSLEDALLVNAFPKYVLIASDQNHELALAKAESLHSLAQGQHYRVPWWADLLSRCVLLVFAIYLVFFHWRLLNTRKRMLIVFGVFCVFVVLNIILASRFSLWVPLSSFMVYYLAYFAAVSLWTVRRGQRQLQQKELAVAISNASNFLESEQKITEAMNLVAHHPDKKLAIEKVCLLTNRLQEERTPIQHIETVVGSLLPLLDYDAQLVTKHAALKKTISEQAELAHTQPRSAPVVTRDIPESLGRYRIQREIGRGAVGVVYLGFDPAISRKVAIKTLDARQFSQSQHEGLKERFFREAEAAGRLNHPNIVSVYDVGEEGDLAFIAMDYVEGRALNECISKSQLLPVAEVYRVMHDVSVALSYAHEHQIVHRDIKPGNLMYSESPYTLKVADFGIARLLDNSQTSTGEILGSPLYMSPEQLKGSKVEATADIFSLGVTFFQLLTGSLPFNADNLASLTYEIIHTKHKNIRTIRKDLPASAARIVNQCLQKNADDRYESAIELAGVFRKAIKRDFPAEAKRWNIV